MKILKEEEEGLVAEDFVVVVLDLAVLEVVPSEAVELEEVFKYGRLR